MSGTLDPGVPSIAGIYDYWLGGVDNFACDREAAEQAIAANPGLDLLEPGVVQPRQWRPRATTAEPDVTAWCGVARKPS